MTYPSFFLTLHRARHWLIPGLLVLLSCTMYTSFLGSPKFMFWDENYHIASAQKHVDGVMYMEPHPPLGKMLMGLSESVFNLNGDKDMSRLVKTDYLKGKDIPKDMQYFGFRFPSAMLMGLSIFFFYHALYLLTKNRSIASVFSLFFIFDNAFAVHARAAMLEGIQIFFMSIALWYTIRSAAKPKDVTFLHYALLGGIVGLATAVKINSLILVLLPGVLLLEQWFFLSEKISVYKAFKKASLAISLFFTSLISVMLFIMYLHIGMNDTVIEGRTYKASPEYLHSLKDNGSWSLTSFTYGLKDHYHYHSEYAKGVPRLDACKKDGENGSSWARWPFGGKSINYRWNKKNDNGEAWVGYSYLVVNPFVWLSAAFGILLSVSLIIGRFLYSTPIRNQVLFRWITYFTALYISYMIAISQIGRVMYLYHYFIPLVFAIINLSLIYTYLSEEQLNGRNTRLVGLVGITVLVIGLFVWFSPFTYSLPINATQFEARNWMTNWGMKVIR
ncbi:MAG: phospholipid carrier-dependent glycosyltransferase [Methyloprofundus sp.]|nr:phospholipid carrier-dependent glycosyltransferase [Methyloprofundus sp.]